MKVAAFITARMTSTRLPGKSLLPLNGTPALLHLVRRARRVMLAAQVIVLTGHSLENDPIRALCTHEGVACFTGHDDDVLTRFCEAVNTLPSGARPDYILRLTADCPLQDPALLDLLVAQTLLHHADYAAIVTGDSAVPGNRYPNGFDGEMISRSALAYADANTHGPQREHVTRALWRDGACDAVPSHAVWHPTEDLGAYSVTLDTAEDYARLQRLWAWHGGKEPDFDSTLTWLKQEVR